MYFARAIVRVWNSGRALRLILKVRRWVRCCQTYTFTPAANLVVSVDGLPVTVSALTLTTQSTAATSPTAPAVVWQSDGISKLALFYLSRLRRKITVA